MTRWFSGRAVIGGASGALLGLLFGPAGAGHTVSIVLLGGGGYFLGLRATSGNAAANAGVKALAGAAIVFTLLAIGLVAVIALWLIDLFTKGRLHF